MKYSTALPILLLVVCSASLMSHDPCQPDCNGQKYTYIPDPRDCTRYYFCLNNTEPASAPMECDSGQEFSEEEKTCVLADPENPCTAACQQPACSFECTDDTPMVRDPYSCNMLHICLGNSSIGPLSCSPSAPYFNGRDCVKESTECCIQGCVSFCESYDGFAADPFDCRKYYDCSLGEPSERSHRECDTGSTFDPATGNCVVGKPCRDCRGDPDLTTSTETTSTSSPVTEVSTGKATTTNASTEKTTTATTTTTTTTTPPCTVPDICQETGKFPVCNYCDPRYYHCSSVGALPTVRRCPYDLVFNTDPSHRYCVLRSDCTYSHT